MWGGFPYMNAAFKVAHSMLESIASYRSDHQRCWYNHHAKTCLLYWSIIFEVYFSQKKQQAVSYVQGSEGYPPCDVEVEYTTHITTLGEDSQFSLIEYSYLNEWLNMLALWFRIDGGGCSGALPLALVRPSPTLRGGTDERHALLISQIHSHSVIFTFRYGSIVCPSARMSSYPPEGGIMLVTKRHVRLELGTRRWKRVAE
ncbi:hypothetical protein B0J12DRAFT_705673 [Macrophomina phaseolina]|uniref:Uncharacterized protein n=1 Tax=Macrophomina phaseolina TaxID=35725 RepID=A0ABQ8FUC7_9PEZI|nr:hypothetical protein B0J12DRAFT_705673 [Macrophomina phaseolina]